jgi:protein SCO1/2
MTIVPSCRPVGLLALLLWLGAVLQVWAHPAAPAGEATQLQPAILRQVGLEQRLGDFIPLDVPFRDETAAPGRLRDYFGSKPVILALTYYDCPNLCTLILNGLLKTLRVLSLTAGKDFNVLIVSINPANPPSLAAAKQAQYVRDYGRAGAARGWHFLTGQPEAIQRLTQAVGFRYTYDAAHQEFVHAAGIMVLTPQGQLARYFYGVEYAPRDIQLGLVEAAGRRIGSPIDQLLLLCYHYDPQSGKYTLAVLQALRLAGVVTVVALGAYMGVMLRRERRKHAGGRAGG